MSKCGAFFSQFGNIPCDERVLSYSENSASSLDSIIFSNNWIKDRASWFPIANKACQWKKFFLIFKSSVIEKHYIFQAPLLFIVHTKHPWLTLLPHNMDKEQRESSPMPSLATSLVPEETEIVSLCPPEHFSLPRHRCLIVFQGVLIWIRGWGGGRNWNNKNKSGDILEWDINANGNNYMSMMDWSLSLLSWGTNYDQDLSS